MTSRAPLFSEPPADAMVGHSPAIEGLRTQIRRLAVFDAVGNPDVPTLLLHGETGTGKGLLARVIHDRGPRARGPFVAVNCAALPETLLEAELFGFEAGAFTDARRAKPGLFEAAVGGTLLLDEIDALPLLLQPKLLTAIEEKRVRRLGATRDRRVDVKLIAATKEALSRLVTAGRLRADLYHRLSVLLLELPPLRLRGADSVLLATHFLQRYAVAHGLRPKRLSAAARAWMLRYPWPGNVRELRYLMERVMLMSEAAIVDAPLLEQLCLTLPTTPPVTSVPASVQAVVDEPTRIQQALAQTAGNVVRAARLLSMSRGALRHRMSQYGITRTSREAGPVWREGREDGESRVTALVHHGRPGPNWEQKLVAVLAVSLVFPPGAEYHAGCADPWTVVLHWEQRCKEHICGLGGVIVHHSPLLLLAIFGAPHALERVAQRALQTGRALQSFVANLEPVLTEAPQPIVRLAVHLGAVLVDMRTSASALRVLAVGDTLAHPVYLLGHARAGELLVSAHMACQVEERCLVQTRVLSLEDI